MASQSTGLLKSLNEFLKLAKENLLWTSAFGLFVLLFWFLIGFIPSAPNRIISSERKAVQFELFVADGERVKLLYDILQDSVSTSRDALNQYQTSFGGVSRSKPDDPRTIVEGLGVVTRARYKLSFAIGSFQGMQFYSPELSEFRKGFEADLRGIDALLETVEKFYVAKASGDENAVTLSVGKLKDAILKNNETMAGLLMRLQAFGERSSALQVEWQLAIQEDSAICVGFTKNSISLSPRLLTKSALLSLAREAGCETDHAPKTPRIDKGKKNDHRPALTFFILEGTPKNLATCRKRQRSLLLLA
jgi:hypothetical protein